SSLFGQILQGFRFHPHRYMQPDYEHTEHQEYECYPLFQVRHSESSQKRCQHYDNTSVLPPAAFIFSSAVLLNLCAFTVRAFVISPSASTFSPSSSFFMIPISFRSSGV